MAYKPKKKQQELIKDEINLTLDDIGEKISKLENLPDAKNHQVISFVKSGVRILGYGFLLFNLPAAVTLLVLSEIVGIIEELV